MRFWNSEGRSAGVASLFCLIVILFATHCVLAHWSLMGLYQKSIPPSHPLLAHATLEHEMLQLIAVEEGLTHDAGRGQYRHGPHLIPYRYQRVRHDRVARYHLATLEDASSGLGAQIGLFISTSDHLFLISGEVPADP